MSDINDAPNGRQNFRIALNLKHLIDKLIPLRFEESFVTSPSSTLLNSKVIQAAYNAAGGKGDGARHTSARKYRSSLIFCLLKVCDWYWQLATTELSDSALYSLRAVAAQQLAKIIIEAEKDDHFLFIHMLCFRHTICLNDEDSEPQNALELAVDMHSTIVIASAGYQRCMQWMWKGWIVQSVSNPLHYVLYQGIGNTRLFYHFNPFRVKSPSYQNTLEIMFSFVYLALYTVVVNTDIGGRLSVWEIFFYIFTLSYVLDQIEKIYLVGLNYLTFWNVFNDTLYTIVGVSMAFRFAALQQLASSRQDWLNEVSYRIMSCAAPFMWCRLLLYLDANQFVGVLLVIVKTMMKDSAVFFFLLILVFVGFIQGFLGLDSADGKREASSLILRTLLRTVIGGPQFQAFAHFAPPYAEVLYYLFTFLVTLILLNFLIALYTTSYQNVVDNSTSEYLALVAEKTLRYVRAPDEHVFVPPLNLIELFLLRIPFRWCVRGSTFKTMNRVVMFIIYAPFLVYVAVAEAKIARRVSYNRMQGLADDANEVDTEWSLTDGFEDSLSEDAHVEQEQRVSKSLKAQRIAEEEDPEFLAHFKNFKNEVNRLSPDVEKSSEMGVNWEHYALYKQVDGLSKTVEALMEQNKMLLEEVRKVK